MGTILKKKRETLSFTLEDISFKIQVRRYYLYLIENNRFDEIDCQVYMLGYLKLYANFLGLDGISFINELKTQELQKTKFVNYKEYQTFPIARDSIIILSTLFSILLIIVYSSIYK